MQAKDAIRQAMGLSRLVLNTYIGDLTDAELLQRPGPGCNHLAWQLGHLISSEAGMLNMLSPGSAPELPEGFKERHGKENAASDNPADFCTRQEYLDLGQQVHAASLLLLESYPEDHLDLPGPEMMRSICPTTGAFFLLIATHPLMHAGQFVPVRRALGKPVLI